MSVRSSVLKLSLLATTALLLTGSASAEADDECGLATIETQTESFAAEYGQMELATCGARAAAWMSCMYLLEQMNQHGVANVAGIAQEARSIMQIMQNAFANGYRKYFGAVPNSPDFDTILQGREKFPEKLDCDAIFKPEETGGYLSGKMGRLRNEGWTPYCWSKHPNCETPDPAKAAKACEDMVKDSGIHPNKMGKCF
ncbi:MAG: hypothetical protein K0U29_06165 [Gammaproteobacteria bacterium]|nr:hypothetical protein [Gammaproteobacteria bacterium]MCH9744499.1 hypothetical protein [Gammaproteobacteria bacterium]